jgi:hypothetical protein
MTIPQVAGNPARNGKAVQPPAPFSVPEYPPFRPDDFGGWRRELDVWLTELDRLSGSWEWRRQYYAPAVRARLAAEAEARGAAARERRRRERAGLLQEGRRLARLLLRYPSLVDHFLALILGRLAARPEASRALALVLREKGGANERP